MVTPPTRRDYPHTNIRERLLNLIRDYVDARTRIYAMYTDDERNQARRDASSAWNQIEEIANGLREETSLLDVLENIGPAIYHPHDKIEQATCNTCAAIRDRHQILTAHGRTP